MSVSESEIDDRKYNWFYFHGEDVRTEKFKKKINKRPTLTYAILMNATIIIRCILIIWIIATLMG